MHQDAPETSGVEVARRWFEGKEALRQYQEFERLFLDMPRQLFLEVALHEAGGPVRRVLDVGCGTGSALTYLAGRLPETELVGLDPSPDMAELARSRLQGRARILPIGVEELPREAGTFDLILSYSNLRLWSQPVRGLSRLASALAPGGLMYLLDMRGDLDAEDRAYVLERVPDPDMRCFLSAQLKVAVIPAQLRDWLEAAHIERFELGLGGLAGHPFYSSGFMSLLQRSERIASLCMRMAQGGFRSPRAAQSVFHLFVR